MQIKVKPLTIAISLVLSACNSSDSNSPTPTVTPTPAASVTLSGVVADDYIGGAIVCLDVNENNACDAGEPQGVTADGTGRYTFEVPNGVSTNYPIVADIPAGASNADSNTGQVQQRTIFSSPAGQGAVISPISTLVHHKIKNDAALTLETAKSAVASDLKTSVAAADLLKDFIKEAENEAADTANTKTEYRDLHRATIILTELMGKELGNAVNAAPSASQESVLDLMMKKMMEIELKKEGTLSGKTLITATNGVVKAHEDEGTFTNADFSRVDLGDDDEQERYGNFVAEIAEHEALHSGSCVAVRSDDNDEEEGNDNDDEEEDGDDDDNNEQEGNEGDDEGQDLDDSSEVNETCVTPTTPAPTTPAPTTPAPTTTPTPTPSTAAGKALYASKSCSASSCHGVNPANGKNKISRAVSASVTRSAINSNKGGMGFLVGISDADLQAIADYVRNPQ